MNNIKGNLKTKCEMLFFCHCCNNIDNQGVVFSARSEKPKMNSSGELVHSVSKQGYPEPKQPQFYQSLFTGARREQNSRRLPNPTKKYKPNNMECSLRKYDTLGL